MNKKYIEKMVNHLSGESIKVKYNILKNDGAHTDEEIKEICPEIKIFSDLKFTPHSVVPKAVMSSLDFDNNHFVSVVGGGEGLYGDGVTTFEVGFPDEADGIAVEGYLSPEEVTELMLHIQSKTITNER